MINYIHLENCKDRMLYRIKCRNFSFGVFNEATKGFIGIREKFKSRYLFTEFHYDIGAPFGTVHPIEELEMLPEGIDAVDIYGGSIDKDTKRMIAFNKDEHIWYFLDTGEKSKEIKAYAISNPKLKEWLEQAITRYDADEQ